MKVEVRLSVFIRKEAKYFLYPLSRYLPKLHARLQSGQQLPVLPYQELSRGKKKQISLDEINKIAGDLARGVTGTKLQQWDNFVLLELPPSESDYHDELVLEWIEPIPENLSKKRARVINLNRQFPATGNASLYVEIIIDDRFELQKIQVFKIEFVDKQAAHRLIELDKTKFSILQDKRNYVLRFPRELPYDISIQYRVGIPEMVSNWLGLGVVLGIAIIPITVFLYIVDMDSFRFTAAWAGGTIALLVGFRVLLFHDVELLKQWNKFYIALVIADLIFLAVFAAFKDPTRSVILEWGNTFIEFLRTQWYGV